MIGLSETYRRSASRTARWAVGLAVLLLAACSTPKADAPVTSVGAKFGDGGALGDLSDSGTGGEDGELVPDVPTVQTVPCAAPGTWGCECKGNDECLSGFCVDSEMGKVCTNTCTSKCAKDWTCLQAAGAADLTYVCVPIFTNLCKPCKSHDECKSVGFDKGENLCIPLISGDGYVNGSFCGTLCETDEGCRTGYSCKVVELPGAQTLTAKQCVPDGGDCGCQPAWVSLQTSTKCSKTNQFGVCSATRSCTDEGLTLCGAPIPGPETCDGEDNDCNGKTDESGAIGCTVYYQDNDSDGAGIGEGVCMCQNPGAGYGPNGGDCNDLVAQIHPGADEICNSIDDNCNGDTDESGAKGCKFFYKDKDGDGFGDDNDNACLCPSKKTKDWIDVKGDCDDTNGKIHPGVKEVCDTADNDCNGTTDEEDAEGCQLWFIDKDKDGFGAKGASKCLCKKNAVFTTDQGGDCDDASGAVHPVAVEVCNSMDDDCDGTTDNGDAPKSCPALAGGAAACVAGKCAVGSCPKGKFDINGKYDDGCECQADDSFGLAGGQCASPIPLGTLPDGGAASVLRTGNVMPGEDADWYQFLGKDTPDDNACDQYNVRVKFLQNPGNQFVFDLFRGSCATNDQICAGDVASNWKTSFYGGAPFGPQAKAGIVKIDPVHPDGNSPVPEMAGECSCTAPGKPSLPGMNICSDNSATYYIRVYRKPGLPMSCQDYTVQFDNGPE